MHRNLTTESCLISYTGYLKIADFVWSRPISDSGCSTICGNLSYFSPEIVRADRRECGYGKSVDWWAVGVIIYTMLNGVLPFRVNDDFKSNNKEKI